MKIEYFDILTLLTIIVATITYYYLFYLNATGVLNNIATTDLLLASTSLARAGLFIFLPIILIKIFYLNEKSIGVWK